jgi:hypothetical protein
MSSMGGVEIPNFTKTNKTNTPTILYYIFSMVIYKQQHTMICFRVQLINKQIPNI